MKEIKLATTSYAAEKSLSPMELLVGELKTVFRDKLAIAVASADQDLFRSGILDSATTIRLLLAIEEHFGLRLPMSEIGAESFRTLANIAELVSELQRGPSPGLSEEDPTVAEVVALFREKMDISIESVGADLFRAGVFDSMTLVSFILHLEERFLIRFPMEELDIEVGVTVATLADLVNRGKVASAERVA
jgi:D-alanine--poly(phosphoribitol) ligase subunit 2